MKIGSTLSYSVYARPIEFVKIELQVHRSIHYRDFKPKPSLDLNALCVFIKACLSVYKHVQVYIP